MVDALNATNQVQTTRGVAFGQPAIINNITTAPMQPDTYKGKSLSTVGAVTTLAAIIGGLIFHKNIGNLIKTHTPKIHEWFGKHIGSHIREFFKAHPDNFAVDFARGAKHDLGNLGDKIVAWFKN